MSMTLQRSEEKKTWMKNDFEYRSYYYMNIDEACASKGSHMTPVTFMGYSSQSFN
jgi:hypothetical protein